MIQSQGTTNSFGSVFIWLDLHDCYFEQSCTPNLQDFARLFSFKKLKRTFRNSAGFSEWTQCPALATYWNVAPGKISWMRWWSLGLKSIPSVKWNCETILRNFFSVTWCSPSHPHRWIKSVGCRHRNLWRETLRWCDGGYRWWLWDWPASGRCRCLR